MELVSTMVTERDIEIITGNLKKVLELEGDVVELGCNCGTTSLFIKRILDKTNKNFHVYDSFEGLPEPVEQDEIENSIFHKGITKTTEEIFRENFEKNNLVLPVIHTGWFKDLDYPDKICFAFFDGDFYTSILDSFDKVYPKLVKGGIVVVHDYGWEMLKGVEKACKDFLKNKPEKIIAQERLGIMVKL